MFLDLAREERVGASSRGLMMQGSVTPYIVLVRPGEEKTVQESNWVLVCKLIA